MVMDMSVPSLSLSFSVHLTTIWYARPQSGEGREAEFSFLSSMCVSSYIPPKRTLRPLVCTHKYVRTREFASGGGGTCPSTYHKQLNPTASTPNPTPWLSFFLSFYLSLSISLVYVSTCGPEQQTHTHTRTHMTVRGACPMHACRGAY